MGFFIYINICNMFCCFVDGDFGFWSFWLVCFVSCGGGNKERKRLCNFFLLVYNGKYCEGNSF